MSPRISLHTFCPCSRPAGLHWAFRVRLDVPMDPQGVNGIGTIYLQPAHAAAVLQWLIHDWQPCIHLNTRYSTYTMQVDWSFSWTELDSVVATGVETAWHSLTDEQGPSTGIPDTPCDQSRYISRRDRRQQAAGVKRADLVSVPVYLYKFSLREVGLCCANNPTDSDLVRGTCHS